MIQGGEQANGSLRSLGDTPALMLYSKDPDGALGSVVFHLLESARVFFDILSAITEIETFARGPSIGELPRLRKLYGKGRWRKRKGFAKVQLPNGRIRKAEIHWLKPLESEKRNSRSSVS